MPHPQRHRFTTALRLVGATVALALLAGGSALAAASWTSAAHQQQLRLIAASEPGWVDAAPVTSPRGDGRADELPMLVRRAASARTAVAVLAGTAPPASPDRSGAVIQVVRTADDESPQPDPTHADIDATLVQLAKALAGHDLASARRLVLHAEQAILVTAVQITQHAVQSAAPDRAARPDDELVGRLDDAVRLAQLAAAARSVEPAARHAAEARDLAATLHSIAERPRAADVPAVDLSPRSSSTDGYANGMIPLEVLCPVSFAPGHRLRCDAADALDALNDAFRADQGANLTVTDSYRSLGGQFAVRAAKPSLAALPGTSNHGWGLAVDLGGGVESYDSRPYAWLTEHAAQYGWHHPTYMDRDGAGPHEPWHWEFGTTDHHSSGTSAARVGKPPVVLPELTGLVAAEVVPGSADLSPSDPVPPVVPDATPPAPPVLPEASLPAPAPAVPEEPEKVGPACDVPPAPGASGPSPVPPETAPESDGIAETHPADELEPPAAIDEPPLPACPPQLDPPVDDPAEPTIPSTSTAEPADSPLQPQIPPAARVDTT